MLRVFLGNVAPLVKETYRRGGVSLAAMKGKAEEAPASLTTAESKTTRSVPVAESTTPSHCLQCGLGSLVTCG